MATEALGWLGRGARPCVLPGVGGTSQGKPQPSSFQTPIFSPTPIPCFFLLAFGCFVWKGFLFGWCLGFFFFSALFLHLFLLVLFWMSMPFSVLD